MALLDAPRASVLLIIAALALGCAVGEGGNGFSSGPALTFGDASAEGGPAGDTDPPDTEGGGTDSATSMSSADGSDAPADTDCTPTDELCNGVDDDCDGEIDNGNPEGGQACETGSAGVCGAGTTVCEGGELACTPTTSASAEVCDGLDNDCNAQVDDGVGGGMACNTGMPGLCADGMTSCAGGAMGCTPVNAPQAESCNGTDDDCDGQADNGNPGGGGACNTGLPGVCAAGTQQCSGGGIICQQNQGAVGEGCNDLDDDCNGQFDEGCCAHSLCVVGVALANGCTPCVAQICAVDPFCCSNSWDAICVGRVGTDCGLTC